MALYVIVAVLAAVGLFTLFGVDIKKYIYDIRRKAEKPPTMKSIINKADGKGGNFITHKFQVMRKLLALSGREKQYEKYVCASVLMAIGGALTAAVLNNIFLVPVFALIGLFIPFAAASLSARGYERQLNSELETAMSIITSSYKRTQNLLSSVAENVDYLHEPCKSVFKGFLGECEFMTSNTEEAIRHMKKFISNSIFDEWCDTLILCQKDRENIEMLEPIINKLRNTDIVQIKLDTLLYQPIRNFFLMTVLVLINFPILFFMNREWWNTLMFTVPGHIAISVVFICFLISLFAMLKAIKPIEFKR